MGDAGRFLCLFFSWICHITALASGVLPLKEHQLISFWWKMHHASRVCFVRSINLCFPAPTLIQMHHSIVALYWHCFFCNHLYINVILLQYSFLWLTFNCNLKYSSLLLLQNGQWEPAAPNTVAFSPYPQPCQTFCSRAGFRGDWGLSPWRWLSECRLWSQTLLVCFVHFITMWMNLCSRGSMKQRLPCSSGPSWLMGGGVNIKL